MGTFYNDAPTAAFSADQSLNEAAGVPKWPFGSPVSSVCVLDSHGPSAERGGGGSEALDGAPEVWLSGDKLPGSGARAQDEADQVLALDPQLCAAPAKCGGAREKGPGPAKKWPEVEIERPEYGIELAKRRRESALDGHLPAHRSDIPWKTSQ
jgi:hypothetical protein